MKSNSGYTLVELLITLALTGLVFIIAGSAIYQLNTAAVFGNDRLTALHEIQNAGFRFSQDVKEARSAAGDSANLTLTMADDSLMVYQLSGNDLVRVSTEGTTTLVREVTALQFTIDDRLAGLTISARGAGHLEESVNAKYLVHLAPLQAPLP